MSVNYDIVICCIKPTEFENFDYNGAMVPRTMALGCTFYFLSQTRGLFRGGTNSSKIIIIVILSTWFASSLLIVHGKKTQAMILGNPFQEAVLHFGESAIF